MRTLPRRIRDSFTEFVRTEASGGILLLLCTVAALALANSPFADRYFAIWQTHAGVGVGQFALDKSLAHWINDGLMALFFLVVGLEIKRELLVGELSSLRKAMLPIFAAVGGMAAPAAIYAMFNAGQPTLRGWGIPMATDIAFSLSVLALLGTRIPTSLKVFLAALAIVDDIGAVLVIALFYTESISWPILGGAVAALGVLAAFNALGVRRISAYLVVGAVVWALTLQSGLHATVAGVLVAFLIPARIKLDRDAFSAKVSEEVQALAADPSLGGELLTEDQQEHISEIERACEQAQRPLERVMRTMHPWQAFLIVPVFALANAGVALPPSAFASLGEPIALGIGVGLALGKPVGVLLLCWIAVKARLAALPDGVSWPMVAGVGMVAGIGFTMSLFIADLAFATGSNLETAKLGILAGSLVSALAGYGMLRLYCRPNDSAQNPSAG